MPDDSNLLVRLREGDLWKNWHETVESRIARVDRIDRPADDLTYTPAALKRSIGQVQRAIREAKQEGRECRAVGRSWSLSAAPKTDGVMIDISNLNLCQKVHHMQVDPAYPGSVERRRGLCFVQGGTYISILDRWLEESEQKLSLRTTGAANGQSISGAISTGTHGSVLDFGAMHDQVVAIHLLAGDQRQLWIERASYPVIRQSVAEAFGAQLSRANDDDFDAVVMGLGAFGVIVQLVIEARPRFLLHAYNYRKDRNDQQITLDAAMRKRIGELDFASDPRLNPAPENGRPYFFQPIVNPNTDPPQVLMTQMYEKPWDDTHVPDYTLQQDTFGPGYDFITVAGKFLDTFDFAVPLFANLIAANLFKEGKKIGTWGELFGYKTERTKVASGTVAVPLGRAVETLDLLLALNHDIGPVPLVFGCRYARSSPALLAFNRWDPTFVVSLDGLHNDDTLDFFDAIPARMDAAGIPFTQHWGKTNGYDPARVRSAFGNDRVDRWIAARERILPDPADRALFSNQYLRDLGLDS